MRWTRRSDGDGQHVEPEEATPTAVPVVVAECEAFLDGSYSDYLVVHGRAVPAWAWLNKIAHGDDEHLGRVAAGDDPLVPADWRVTLSLLARRATEEVQRNVLVPLELELIEADLRPDLTPGQLATLAIQAIEEWAALGRRDG
jgi:hypothetical protein